MYIDNENFGTAIKKALRNRTRPKIPYQYRQDIRS
jgi:hypothetical protein